MTRPNDAITARLHATGRIGRRLVALRCPDCEADTVICHEGKVWALGPEDYGPRGSYMQAVADE